MNKRRYQILRTRIKPPPRESRQPRIGAASLLKNIPFRIFLGLLGAIVISFFAFHFLTPQKIEPKSAVNNPLPAATVSASPVVMLPESDAALLADLEKAHPGTPLKEEPAVAGSPAPSQSAQPNPSVSSKATAGSGDAQSTQAPAKDVTEAKRPAAERKNIEKQRVQAERKRSRLESMYQKHLISSEAYKSGQEEYKNEIQKYRLESGGSGTVAQ
jgi:hypothetical protein